MTAIADDVEGFDDVGMFESGTDTKLGSNLLLVVLLTLARSFRPKLFDSEDIAVLFSLDQPDGTARARPEDPAPFAILLGEVCLCGLRK